MLRSKALLFILGTMAWKTGLGARNLPAPPAADIPGQQEVVVTGRRYDPVTPKQEPIDYFRDYCFESNRLKGRSAIPRSDRNWQPLDDDLRAKLKLTDPDVPAYQLVDEARGHTLILEATQTSHEGLLENRCTLIVIGRTSASLREEMSALFRSQPVQGPLDHENGMEPTPGWQHWLWTAMPGRHSKDWNVFKSGMRTSSTWYIVLKPELFYTEYDYILGDLKVGEGAHSNVSIMSFVLISGR